MSKPNKPTYDPACYDLAEHFLQDEPFGNPGETSYEQACHDLALTIQQAVEDWFPKGAPNLTQEGKRGATLDTARGTDWRPLASKPPFQPCEERGIYTDDGDGLFYFKATHWRPLSVTSGLGK